MKRLMLMAAVAMAALCTSARAQEYEDKADLAFRQGKFMVAFVGDSPPGAMSLPDAIICRTRSLEGYDPGDVIVSGPWHWDKSGAKKERFVEYVTLKNPTRAQIEAALTAGRGQLAAGFKKEVSPVAAAPFTECPCGCQATGKCECSTCPAASSVALEAGNKAPVGAYDALAEVNAKRAQHGLRPYTRDEGLTAAATRCAEYRAANLIKGHCNERGGPSDFAFLPPGANAAAAGCGAMSASWGWQSCCDTDHYTYAGAAVVTGRDGQRYMHLFVR